MLSRCNVPTHPTTAKSFGARQQKKRCNARRIQTPPMPHRPMYVTNSFTCVKRHRLTLVRPKLTTDHYMSWGPITNFSKANTRQEDVACLKRKLACKRKAGGCCLPWKKIVKSEDVRCVEQAGRRMLVVLCKEKWKILEQGFNPSRS